MRFTAHRAQYEAALGRAHRAVNQAKEAADQLGEDGAWLDLNEMEVHLIELNTTSLKGRPHKRAPEAVGEVQLELPPA